MIDIAIVEDDYRIANIHEEFLRDVRGVRVVGKALNGMQTLELLKTEKVDLVILDIYMPDILGSDLIQKIRDIHKETDIIIVSAAAETDIVTKVIRQGVFDYIIKPVIMERFIETIERYKKVRKQLDTKSEINQLFLDDYFGYRSLKKDEEKQTPKGIDPLTLEKIQKTMDTIGDGITAEEMGEKIGVSRTTARRYLEYLISTNDVMAELEYGIVGRPERRYHLKNRGK